MKSAKTILKIIIPALVLLLISSCKNTPGNIPFPENETDFPQPVSKPLKFSDVKKLNWTNDVSPLKPLIKKFDFDKLPVKVYDTSAFVPFAHKPDTVKFDYDKLPDTAFDYDKLPTIPLKFETSVLEPPEIIEAGPPRLKKGSADFIYDLQALEGEDVTCIFEDKAGFLWIATEKALYRYDGENLALFMHITPNYEYAIISILEDNQGQIWIGTTGYHSGSGQGIFIINPEAGIIKHLTTLEGIQSENIQPEIDGLLLDDKGRMWASAYDYGVIIIDQNSGFIKHFDQGHGLSDNSLNAVIQDNKNNIWISTDRGVDIVDLKNRKIKYLNSSAGLDAGNIWSMKQDSMNRVWTTGEYGKLSSIDLKGGTVVQYGNVVGRSSSFPVALLDDNRGKIWIGNAFPGKAGVVIIDPVNRLIKTIKTSDGLNANNIRDILQDKRGQVWIATWQGLNMVDANSLQHIGKTDISTLLEDQRGKIWIGNVNAGIDILDTLTGLSRSFTAAQGLSNNMEEDMIENDGKIFIITNGGGIDIIDSSRKTIEHIGKSQGLKTDTATRIIRDKQGFYWVAESGEAGLQILDLEKNIIHNIGIEQGLSDSSLDMIKQDREGRIWFISDSDAGIIDNKANTINYLDNLPGIKGPPSMTSLLEDEQGNMWIDKGRSVYVINSDLTSYISFSTKEGLLSNDIRSLNKYSNQIYVGTGGGINILTPPNSEQKKWKIKSYGQAEGILKYVWTQNSDVITKNGVFLWGDMGITILKNDIAGDTIVPKTYISGMAIFSEPQSFYKNPWPYLNKEDTLWTSAKDSFYLDRKLPASHPFNQNKIKWDSITGPYNMPVNLRFNYDENYIQFYFSQFNSGSVDRRWYSYVLEGIDKKWSKKTIKAYSANYPNLPPGHYTFKVCSEGSNGLWSKPAAFEFTILSPWWQTWWFYLVEAIAAIAILYWIVRLISQEKLPNKKLNLKSLKRSLQKGNALPPICMMTWAQGLLQYAY